MPRVSDDDVVDFQVMEAVAVKMDEKRKKQEEDDERAQKRGSHRNLRGMKGGQRKPETTQ